jgi:tetratricopeptide (TPR) repeat protein
VRLRGLGALGALVVIGLCCAACRSGAPAGRPPAYLFDPRIGFDAPFPKPVEEGWILLLAGRPVDALRAFQSAAASPAAKVGRIESLLESGRTAEARAACEQAFQSGFGTIPLLAACGETAARQEQWAEAFDLFEAAGLRSPDLAQLLELKARAAPKAVAELVRQGLEAIADNEIAEAETAADRAVAIESASRAALRLSGDAALARDDAGKAFRRYRAAWKLDPGDLDSGERAGDLALKNGRYDAGYEIFAALSRRDSRFASRAEECQEEFVISNWPGPDRDSAHAARLTRAQAAALLWRLVPEIRIVPVSPSAPIASDILSRNDQRVLAHCLGIGLLTVDASTHRARPDVFLSRAEALRFLLRTAALTGLGKATACVDEKAQAEGLLSAAAACGLLPAGKNSVVSGREFRRAIAVLLSAGI